MGYINLAGGGFLVFLSLLLIFVETESTLARKPRLCCRYANVTENSSTCPDSRSCSLKTNSGEILHPNLERCLVQIDTKRDQFSTCKAEIYLTDNSNKAQSNSNQVDRVLVKTYLLEEDAILTDHVDIFGLEVAIPYYVDWKKARFRLQNTHGCDQCSPRCVEIERLGAPSAQETLEYLTYDCELGFYITETMISKRTHGSTYSLDICLDNFCKSFLLQMPDTEWKIMDENLVLVEKDPLVKDGNLRLHFPPGFSRNVTVKIEESGLPPDKSNNETAEETVVLHGELDINWIFEAFIGMDLSPDVQYSVFYQYQNSVWIKVAQFQTGPQDKVALGLVLFFLFMTLLAIATFLVYRRYQFVERTHQVNPNRLLESGRIKPRNVLIISNVDNRHHIDIILSISKYLKAHCAVGEVYFALDPNTGISTHANQDPWKWAQETVENISKEGGFLIFVAAPPPGMGLAIYKDLPNNQAFIGAAYLKSMSDEDRIAVLHLPYTDPETVPTILPVHVRNNPFCFPRDANAFLCQLLEVKMRELFPCVPIPMVRPKILPQDLCLYKGGKELLADVATMTSKVDLYKAEQKLIQGNLGTMPRTEDSSTMADSEFKGLLRPKFSTNGTPGPSDSKQPQTAVSVNIEAGVLSLNDSAFEDRDKSVNAEFV